MKIYGEKAEQSEMIYPQNVQKWYTESGLFPLWITGGGTAVISFEGLKRNCRPCLLSQRRGGTAVISFERIALPKAINRKVPFE